MYWDWADRPPLPPPRQTGGDSRRFWQDLQITAFLRGGWQCTGGWRELVQTPGWQSQTPEEN